MRTDLKYEHSDIQIARLKIFLYELLDKNGSDLHIKADSKVYARINGEILILSNEVFLANEVLDLAKELLRGRFNELVANKEINLTFKLSNEYSFRINIFFQKDGVSMALRAIAINPPTLASLELSKHVLNIVDYRRGLVLVTGSTGSGKSTTLAAIINEINNTKYKHIITIEDPIEFIYINNLSIINQRSVGEDTTSFHSALKSALREDPDVILVGEMRDLESIETALIAAETGHLVFSTLHTLDAVETINRIISVFPANEQNRIRYTLSSALQAVISQRLVQTLDGKRRVACEILFITTRIQELIRQNKDDEIRDAISEGKLTYGMQTFDQALIDLYNNNIIDENEAIINATSPNNVRLALQGIDTINTRDKHINVLSEIKLKRDGV